MNTGSIAARMALCVALLMGFTPGVGMAQVKVKPQGAVGVLKIHQLTGYGPRALMHAPDSNNGGSRRNSREWVEMSVQYDSDPEWIDEVTFQFYALLRQRATGEYTLIKGSVAYVDVARGRAHLGVAYIKPNALLRWGDVVGVAVEASIKGEVVSSLSEGKLGPAKPLPQDWWLNQKLVEKDGYIVEKARTPFAIQNFDDYEMAK